MVRHSIIGIIFQKGWTDIYCILLARQTFLKNVGNTKRTIKIGDGDENWGLSVVCEPNFKKQS